MRSIVQQINAKIQEPLFKHFFGVDGLVLFLLPIVAVVISMLTRPTFFTSVFIFFGLPALYLSIRSPKYIVKLVLFSLLAGIPLIIILEYIGGPSLAWAFPPSVVGFYLFHQVSLEILLWAFFNIYAVVIFYEHIFDQHRKVAVWNKKMWTLVRYLIGWMVIFLLLLILNKGLIILPYFYFLFGIVIFIFPLAVTWLYYPKTLPKIFYSLVYFSYLSFLYEIMALTYGWWSFPGTDFVGYVTFFHVTFPIEELVFWIILFAPSVICAFEYLDDDCK